ncbi:hypothetical protein ABMY35_02685 [Pseudoalteromonas sp. BZB3]|uniref:hypothetical protein n=1 Tax=Pseudoalteromonas sp. BZB3 TaxID=3136670 RepID=UPI0032C3EDDB
MKHKDRNELESRLQKAFEGQPQSFANKVPFKLSAVINITVLIPLKNIDFWERHIRFLHDKVSEPRGGRFWGAIRWKQPSISVLDLCSWDGHRREYALKAANTGLPNSFFVILFLRRLNDWVPQVRDAARGTLETAINNTDPNEVAKALIYVFQHWTSWQRINEQSKELLLCVLYNDEVFNKVKELLIKENAGPLSRILTQIGRIDILDSHLAEIAKCSVQPALRAKAFRFLLEKKVSWYHGREWVWTDKRYGEGKLKPVIKTRSLTVEPLLSQLIEEAAHDPSSIVRRVSAEMLIGNLDSLDGRAYHLAKYFSRDTSKAVSERGKFALKKLAGESIF